MKEKNKQLKWLFKTTKGSRFFVIMLILVAILGSVASVFIAYLLRGFVDLATGSTELGFADYLKMTIVALVVLGILSIVGTILKASIFARTEGKLREKLLSVLMTRNLADVQKVHSGELMVLLSDDIAEVSEFFPNLINGIFKNIVLVISSIVVMFIFSWQIALIILIVMPIMIVSLNLFMPIMQKRNLSVKENEDINRKHMQETVTKILLFKAYAMLERVISLQNSLYKKKHSSLIKMAALEGTSSFINMLFTIATFLIILGIGTFFVLRGDTTIGSLVGMLNLIGNITNPLGEVSNYISRIAKAKASAQRIGRIIELPQEKQEYQTTNNLIRGIKAERLSFAYDNGDVLEEINFEANQNEIIGIIGESGCGKSTLTKLLMGLYEPKSGRIDYISDSGTIIHNKLSHIAYVPSDNFLFNGTVAENICMGEKINEKIMEVAAKDANIHEFIQSLPNNYNEMI